MLRLPRRVLFAVEAVLDVAYNAGGATVRSGEITERQGIPARYLEPVLQQLVRAGVLVGVRGPRGGYRLGRDARRITVGDVVRIAAGGEDEAEDEALAGGSPLGRAVVRPMVQALEDEAMARLDAITIDALCVQARAAGIKSANTTPMDFTI
ncbi:MAG: Rrf2 family transcriptional regulator [Alphaproteobacteria bacterium]|nr:Rrf2 family transcriptional regulator [Alphaproteobacteria bacterium]